MKMSFKSKLWSLILATVVHAAMVIPPLIRDDYSFAVSLYAVVGALLIVCAWIVLLEQRFPKLGGKAGQDFYDGFAQTRSGRFDGGGPHISNRPRRVGVPKELGMGYGADLPVTDDREWDEARKAEQSFIEALDEMQVDNVQLRVDPAFLDGPNAAGTVEHTARGGTRLW